MGIVKIRHQGAFNKNLDQQSSRPFIVNGLTQGDRSLTGKDDDWDDSDLAEVGCELAMVGSQMCSIPYDLYELSNLKDILSLETWDSCLTAEERFHLAAYLPDMSHETFALTMKGLLGGDDLFFGSPLEKLFHRLKAGHYSPQVTYVRESLRVLQKRGHYHSLRLYHESMTQKFVNMKKAWSNCQSNTTIEERIGIWNHRKDQKPVLLVDLNVIPSDEEPLNRGDKDVEGFPLLKKAKYMEEDLKPHTTAIDLNSASVNTKPKGKGVLKVRGMETNSMSNHRVQLLSSDTWESGKRVPKGVLKIKPKIEPYAQPERPITGPIPLGLGLGLGLGQSSANLYGAHASESSPPLSASQWHEETDSDDADRSSEKPEPSKSYQREDLMNMGVRSFGDSHSFPSKIRMALSSRFHNASEPQAETIPPRNNRSSRMKSDEASDVGDCRNGDSICQNSEPQSRASYVSISTPGLFSSLNPTALTPLHHMVSEEIERKQTAISLPQFLEHSEHRHKNQIDEALSITSDSTHVSGVEREVIFPITYKRKKACTKVNPVESFKQLPVVANSESINSTECNPIGKAKTVRIKIKGWNNKNSQFKRELFNGLQHGSPST